MGTKVKYFDLLTCQVSKEMHDWYHAEAKRRGTIFKRYAVSDVMREALQFYIDHHIEKPKA